MAVKIDMLETVLPHVALAAGLTEEPEFRVEATRFSKCDRLLHDGSVRLDSMTDDVNEAKEVRIQTGRL